MLENWFIRILNMSLTACAVIAAVMLVRLLLRKAPSVFSYALWAVVLFRLLCPVSFSAGFSLFGAAQAVPVEGGRMEYIPEKIAFMQEPAVSLPLAAVEETVNDMLPQGRVEDSVYPVGIAVAVGSVIWLLGVLAMAGYGIVTMAVLKIKLRSAPCQGENVYIAENMPAPFVLGIFCPRIYLPSALKEEEKEYILLHERIHIRRGDPVLRLAAYLALCLHWFNPLVWAAFVLSGRDMEMSCDEAVIRKLGDRVKKEYSMSLLTFAAGRGMGSRAPLAFGEGDTGSRVRNVLHYKKPALWAVFAAVALCAAAAAVLVTNPDPAKEESAAAAEETEEYQTYYGVLKEEKTGDTTVWLVTIPGIGDVGLPEARAVYPWFETEYFELESGDLLQINFSKAEEAAIQETDPASFSGEAESIWAMARGLSLEYEGTDLYRFSFARGLLPGEDVKAGDMLTIWLQTEGADGYYQPVSEDKDSMGAETIAVVPILDITLGEAPAVVIGVTTPQIRTILENLGFGVRFSPQAASAAETVAYEVSVRSVSKSARAIDAYVRPDDMDIGEEGEALYFAEDCVFTANYEMAGIGYEEISFDTFADLIAACDPVLNKPCMLTFRDGLIVKAELESAYGNYGISFREVSGNYEYEEFVENGMEEIIKDRCTLVRTEELDLSDRAGLETAEVYTGRAVDGWDGGGYVLFRDAEGELIWTESAFLARAGWKNIYFGESDGINYILKVHIEDREEYGEYAYEAFRLDGKGSVNQIAGSAFEWGGLYEYDDALFEEWASGMEYYLKNSYLVLSTQNGMIRTERISEADRYNYETLKR